MSEMIMIIEITRKYYPQYAKRGFIFYTNVKRPANKRRIRQMRKEIAGEGRQWDCENFVLTGEMIVANECKAVRQDGSIDANLVPVFAKYKKAKE